MVTARMFVEGGKVKLHWHTPDLKCREASFTHAQYAIEHAQHVGVTHVIIGFDDDLDNAVPISEAGVLVAIDGTSGFEAPLFERDVQYVH